MLKIRFRIFLISALSLGLFLIHHVPEIYAVEETMASTASHSKTLSGDVGYAWEVLAKYHRKPSNIDRTIEILEGKLKEDPQDIEALLLLSRTWLTYGYVKAKSKEELIRVFENGKLIAEKALKLEPDNPDAHFFYVANLASIGDVKGLFNSLFMLPEVRRELDLILELDPNHENGLAMQGALFYYLPGILGGDIKISEIYIRRALSVDPHLSSAKLYLAMNLRKQKRYEEALTELHELVMDQDPTFYPDWHLNRKYALRMIKRINKQMEKESGKGIKLKDSM